LECSIKLTFQAFSIEFQERNQQETSDNMF